MVGEGAQIVVPHRIRKDRAHFRLVEVVGGRAPHGVNHPVRFHILHFVDNRPRLVEVPTQKFCFEEGDALFQESQPERRNSGFAKAAHQKRPSVIFVVVDVTPEITIAVHKKVAPRLCVVHSDIHDRICKLALFWYTSYEWIVLRHKMREARPRKSAEGDVVVREQKVRILASPVEVIKKTTKVLPF